MGILFEARLGALAPPPPSLSNLTIFLVSDMKVIPLSEAKARLSYYSRLCRKEAVVVTVKGVPVFQMAPLDEDDDLIDRLLEYNPKFRAYLKQCLKGRSLSSAEALRRLK
ncbi:MAG: type II toxin-antitoxin system Phd/YefM family antitoxin [Planctomycetes bacterium]|nr:type II toxin-antitoxin system Phd/YefM family antitoxin [Planctomycetota bacterium]